MESKNEIMGALEKQILRKLILIKAKNKVLLRYVKKDILLRKDWKYVKQNWEEIIVTSLNHELGVYTQSAKWSVYRTLQNMHNKKWIKISRKENGKIRKIDITKKGMKLLM